MKPATLLAAARTLTALLGLALVAAACGAPPDAPAPAPAPTSPYAYISASLTPGCGNGVLEPELGEVCDDGNPYDLDGCGSTCMVDVGYVCVGERPSVCSSPDESDGPEALGNAKHSRYLPPVSPFTGQDFWTGFPKNLDTPTALGLKIAGDPGATYTVTDTSGTSLASGTIPASGIASVTVTVATYQITTNGAATNQGIHVTASSSVRVLATSESMFTTDTWAVWSTDKLGLDYRMMTVPGRSGSRLQILFVGTKAGTTATLRDTAGTVQATMTLGIGQTYLYRSGATSTAGWTMTSNHPVAVIPGSECENLGGACDLVGEQLAPVKNWAKDYVVGPTFFKATVDAKHMVFARDDDTAIVITRNDGVITNLTLNAGQTSVFLDSIGAGAFGYLVTADKPIAIGSLVSDLSSSWDVSLVYWPPIDGYVASAKMPTSGYAVTYTNYLTLTARTAATSYLRVNGAAVAGWTEIASTGFSFARVAVPNGDNEITASGGVKFGAVASGGATSVSYAYASPYDIASVGGTTNCYLGTTPPDYETELAPSAGADADDLANVDDEDALTFPTSLPMNAASPSLTIPCNDNYFGVDATATVHGWVDFNRDGAFSAAEHASAFCDDATPYSNGSAVLTWGGLTYTTTGLAAVRLRVCDNTSTCDSPTGDAFSGEVEDHQLHVGVCGDGFLDTFDLCDDGGTAAGDGCSATCTVEAGFACSGNPSVCLLTQAPVLTSPPSGTLTNDNTPDLGGTCVAGSTVRVLEGETVLCSSSCATGTFSCTSSVLADGARALTADQQIGAHRSVRSAVLVVNVDTAAPNGPVISTPANGAVIADTTPRVTGTCEPGAVVTVRENATSLCTATCTAASTFACDTSVLSQGAHVLIARQVDVGGNSSADGNAVTVTLDTSAPAVPVITVPAAGATVNDATPNVSGTCETGTTVKVYEGLTQLCSSPCVGSAFACDTVLLANGAHTIAPRQTDAAGNSSPFGTMVAFTLNAPPVQPVITVPTEGGLVAANPSITMSCQPGNTIKLREGATELCSATCAASVYSCQPALTDGAHAVVAWQISPAALVGPDSATRSFTVDGTTPGLPVIASPAAGGVANDAQPTFTGTCESDATVQVYDGATLLCQSVCAASTFACTSGTAYPEQFVTVKARQRDAAGNQGAYTADHTFRILFDSTPPSAPVLTAPVAGLSTNDATPDVTGSCETDAFVEVFEGATPVCTTTCAASAFTCESITLVDGAHTFKARQTDPAGNVGAFTADRSFTIDTSSPTAATITAPAAAAVLSDATPTIGGACETGTTVTVREGASVLCSTTCAASLWTCDATTLAEGAHAVDATQVDAAGNSGPASAARSFTVDTLVPAAPAIATPLAAALLSDTTPTVTGSCETGATVTVGEGATVRCSTTCAASLFSCDSSLLGEGAHSFTATQVDAASNTSLASVARSFSIDSLAPATPTIATPLAGAALPDTTPTVTGACETGATVTVREGASVLCSATCAGSAFTCDAAALAQGAHSVTVTQVDPTGNTSAASAARTFTVDTLVPSAPAISTPVAAAQLSDTTPTVTGSCETGATVTVREGATVRCSTTCAASLFSCDSSVLGEGAHTFTATQVDAASNTSAASAAVSFGIDSLAPSAPSIASPLAAARLSDTTPTLSGACESGAVVEVREDATLLCSTTCAGSSWSCTASVLGEGAHTVTTTQRDAAGNVSPASGGRSFTVDSIAPLAPAITAPLAAASLSDATPTVTGSCETGATVNVLEGATVRCTTTCAASLFSCDSAALADGPHTFLARQTDAGSNVSPDSATRSFTVDTAAPALPVIASPLAAARLSDATPDVSGSCETGATVSVKEGATERCNALCAASAFTCTSASLTEGNHTFTATQTDAAGNVSGTTAGRTFSVDTLPPAQLVITSPSEGARLFDDTQVVTGACELQATVSVYEAGELLCTTLCTGPSFACFTSVLAEGPHTVIATQADRTGNVSVDSLPRNFTIDRTAPLAPALSAPVAGSVLSDSTPAFGGTCETGATVFVRKAATVLCSATCVDGAFACTSSVLTDGAQSVYARQTDAAGNGSADSAPLAFTIDTTPPLAPAVQSPVAGSLVATATPTLSGSCESGTTVRLSEGASLLCSAPCVGGSFACASSLLGEGDHAVVGTQEDAAGNVGPASVARAFTVDTVAPAAPVVLAPLAGALLTDATPTLTGSCESGANVELFEGAAALCSALCVDGAFSCTAPTLLDGAHTVAALQTDPAGNGSLTSAGRSFTVDTAAPLAPAFTLPAEGAFLSDATPLVNGTCESDANVEILEGAVVRCATLCVDGAFSCSSAELADGPHTFTTRQTDAAGNAGAVSLGRSFTVDTTAPEAPGVLLPAEAAQLSDLTPALSGSCETASVVELFEGATLLCSTPCVDGAFACDASELAQGAHLVTATQRDRAGNVGLVSAGRGFTVDTIAPEAPSFTAPEAAALLATGTPEVTGACEAGAIVRVYEGALQLCSAPCDAGLFACTSSSLTEGEHVLTARQSDAAGNESLSAADRTFTVDTLAPALVLFDTPADGALLAVATATLGGVCETGASVEVLEDVTVACTATCVDARFSCEATLLADGTHTFTARQTDPTGNLSDVSLPTSVVVDTTAPEAPVIDAPVAGAFLPGATPAVAGLCESGATVEVLEGALALCAAPCVGGSFECATTALMDGPHTFTARQTDPAGNLGPEGALVSVTIDTTLPVAPAILSPVAGLVTLEPTLPVSGSCESGATVEVSEVTGLLCSAPCIDGAFSCVTPTLSEGAHTLVATQRDPAGNQGPASAEVAIVADRSAPTTLVATGPAAGALLGDATPTVTGSCETAATVEVREGANLLCSATCVAGAFSCTTSTLTDGSHTLSLRQRDPAGNEGTPVTVAGVVIDTASPTGPVLTSPTAAQQLSDASPTVQGLCETGATVDVLEGATVLCTAACALGNFQCDAPTLSDGQHTFTARQTDRAGNRSVNGPGVSVAIDTAAPGLPTVGSPLADVVYDVDTVLVAGSCESLSLVEVLEGQVVLCSALCVDGAFSCEAGPLAEGTHDVSTRQTDRAGNVGAPTLPVHFAIDTMQPIAPVFTGPAADARLADTTPTFEGDCESGATVRVLEGETVLCSALCVAGGFTCDATELTDGVHSVTTRQIDAGGNDSPESEPVSFEIDTTGPIAPAFVEPVDGATLTDATPTFVGTAEPFATITVTEDAGGTTNAKPGDVVRCTAQVDADGAWSCDATDALADGPHVVEATATDALGNVGELTAIVGFELDTSAPLAPTLLSPSTGETVGLYPTFGGLAQPGVTVEVRVDDAVVCTAVADRTGAFACVADAALGLGAHTAVANALDEVGNRSGSSAEVGFTTADGVAPGAPVFSSPTQDGATPDGQPRFAGRAEPGATVEVRIDGTVVCTATADETGAFACEASLPEGSYVATATARNEAGESVASLPLRFVIDQTAPAAPTLTTPAADATAGTRPLFAGTAEAGTVVTVTVDGAPVCVAIADGAGRWSCQAVEPLGEGAHVAVASATDAAGNVSSVTGEVAFDVALGLPPVATIVRPVEGSTLPTSTVLFAGLADPGSRVALSLDNRAGCEAIAAGNGAFSCTMTDVADGPHVATATASNDLGTGPVSPWVTFVVDTTAPVAPVLVTPEDGATTNAWPRFEGTAERFTLVQVTLDGRALCVAEADVDGAFACNAARPLALGAHVAAAISYDALGLASPASAPHTFTVSVQVPAILSPVDEALLADSTPEVTGTAQPGHALRVLVGEVVGCSTTVTEGGTFACTIDPALADGVYTLVAIAADGFGTEFRSPEQTLTIDTAAPAEPTLTSPAEGEQVIGETTTFSGEGEPGSTITVEVDGETACTAVVAADGTWSCEAILTEGTHEVTVTAEDAAGNVSTTSAGTSIETAAALPKPVITAPKSGEEFEQGEVGVAGTTLARASVKVTDDLGQTLCTVTADDEGVFSCTAKPVPGKRTIRAVATVGQQASPASDPVTFTVFDDVGFAGGGVGCGCTSSTGAATGLWALVVFAFFGLRRRRTVK